MYKEETLRITLMGSAETKERAFSHIFSQVKGEAAKQCPGIILQIEPQDVNVISAVRHVYTEHFLGFLWPRLRTQFTIKVQLSVRIRSVDLAEVHFAEEEEKLSHLKQLIQMR